MGTNVGRAGLLRSARQMENSPSTARTFPPPRPPGIPRAWLIQEGFLEARAEVLHPGAAIPSSGGTHPHVSASQKTFTIAVVPGATWVITVSRAPVFVRPITRRGSRTPERI